MVTQERKPRTVQRVKRPLFTKRDWDGIYFENLFEQGLVGDRPSAGQIGSQPTVASDDNDPNNDPPTQPMDNGLRWSQVITTDVLGKRNQGTATVTRTGHHDSGQVQERIPEDPTVLFNAFPDVRDHPRT